MKKFIFYSAMVLMVIGCKPKTKVGRDERNMAFDRALDFAEVVFFQQNYKKAYLLISKDCEETFEEFCSGIDKLHPKGFPIAVRATEYEPIPGQEKINIFLYGGNGDEEFYYRLVMEGTCERSYKVFSLERAGGPYPPSELRERLITISPVIRYKKQTKKNCQGQKGI
ncbi:MAG: hypothetical protein ACYS0C_03160 [Planctomycetota bacterium]|jgi:hypothetical protein